MSILSELDLPRFKAGGMPDIDPAAYRFSVEGLVEEPASFSLDDIKAMPQTTVDARLTSVSGFSVRAPWRGVLWRDFTGRLALKPKANHARFFSWGGGYDTTVSLRDLDHPRVLLAHGVGDDPLEPEYGGPLRMVIPQLYGYKSAKWLERIEFLDHMMGGYWEDRGYTRSGVIQPGQTLDVNTGQHRPISGGEVTGF